jgi:hypothetical protein
MAVLRGQVGAAASMGMGGGMEGMAVEMVPSLVRVSSLKL